MPFEVAEMQFKGNRVEFELTEMMFVYIKVASQDLQSDI